jgi:hypothetical protein
MVLLPAPQKQDRVSGLMFCYERDPQRDRKGEQLDPGGDYRRSDQLARQDCADHPNFIGAVSSATRPRA